MPLVEEHTIRLGAGFVRILDGAVFAVAVSAAPVAPRDESRDPVEVPESVGEVWIPPLKDAPGGDGVGPAVRRPEPGTGDVDHDRGLSRRRLPDPSVGELDSVTLPETAYQLVPIRCNLCIQEAIPGEPHPKRLCEVRMEDANGAHQRTLTTRGAGMNPSAIRWRCASTATR